MGQKSAIVLPTRDLDADQRFFVDLGFRVDLIRPADDPALVELSGFGLTIILDSGGTATPGAAIRLAHPDHEPGETLVAPNGVTISFAGATPASDRPDQLDLPPLVAELVVDRGRIEPGGGPAGIQGRAGMRYLDLLPSRLGGRYIASWIEVADGGPLADWVHHHAIRFQMIHCHRGWVKVVYEDQGDPFVMHAGDGVLQPPGIRHRVLESSAGAAVVEVGCPAEHDTISDHELTLPTGRIDPERTFGGQRFVRYRSADPSADWIASGWRQRDTGIAAATDGLAHVIVVNTDSGAADLSIAEHSDELLFGFVLGGSVTFSCAGQPAIEVAEGGSWTIPAGIEWQLATPSADLEFLLVQVG